MSQERGSQESLSPLVAYVWSTNLQDAADQLPANLGRSSRVHGLIRALDLLGDVEGSQGKAKHARVEQMDVREDEEAANAIETTSPIKYTGDGRATIVEPDVQLGSEIALKRYHEEAYVDYLLTDRNKFAHDELAGRQEGSDESSSLSASRPSKKRKVMCHGLEHDCPAFHALPQYAALVAASTQTACRLLAKGQADIAINWDGGRHHAMRNRASGFCYVADIVLGIMLLSKEGRTRPPPPRAEGHGIHTAHSESKVKARRPRILYLDFDIHYGDGVAQAFHSPASYPLVLPEGKKPPRPPQVLTLSVHHSSPVFFPPGTALSALPSPETTHPFSLSVPLAAYPRAATYGRVFRTCVEPIMRAFDPDYIVLQLGADGLPGDRVGQYGNWSIHGEGSMTWVAEQVKAWQIPLCVLGGGGYEHQQTARAWAAVTSVLVGRPLSSTHDVPHHTFFPEYAPSFTLEMPSSHVADENTEETLLPSERSFKSIAARIRNIIHAWS